MEEYAVVVVGTSAGGTMALRQLFSQLPGDLQAPIFVVQHLYPEAGSVLPDLLSRAGALPAVHPRDGEAIQPGKVYVAPPDCHLLVAEPGTVALSHGARENLHRPSIDPLFRSVARHYGRRTIGVLLTGTRDDGVAGLLAVKMRGGIAIVQDPHDADFPEMPQNALEQVDHIDYVAALAEIPELLVRCVRHVIENSGLSGRVEDAMAGAVNADGDSLRVEPQALICPECGGALRVDSTGSFIQFQCHVGHTFGTESLRLAYGEKTEQALWAALRALKEQVALLEQMATRTPIARLKSEYQKQAVAAREHAQTLQEVLRTVNGAEFQGDK